MQQGRDIAAFRFLRRCLIHGWSVCHTCLSESLYFMTSRRDLWVWLFLVLAIAAVYSQVSDHEFINYDDPAYVTGNPHVRNGLTRDGLIWAFTSGEASNWFPLTRLFHMLDCQFFGLRSGAHHVTNVVLHACNTLLLFELLKRITGAPSRSGFVAFVFALHPLHVESVAWVAERKDVLSALFWFLTLWTYVNYVERPSAGHYLLVVLLFCCGLMSKPMVVTLPFVMLLLDAWPLRRVPKAPVSRLVIEKAPLFALSIISSIVTYVVQQRGGSVSSLDLVAIPTRIQNALVTYVVYLGQFFWPAKLAVVYPYVTDRPAWQWIAAGLVLAGFTTLVLRARRPYLAVGWFWYVGSLVPVIGLVQVGVQSRADRYTYLPMIGISIMLAWGVTELFEQRRWPRMALASLSAAVCAVWLVMTWINLGYWQNSITLFEHAIVTTDENYVAHNNLGAALRSAGRITEAIPHFETALSLRPADAQIQENLGEALMASGRIDDAIPHLASAVRLQPDLSKAHVGLGSALVKRGRIDEAASEYRTALLLTPDSAEAHYGLGAILMSLGQREEALPHLQESVPHLMEMVRIQPDYADAHYNLAAVYELLGRMDDAIAQFSETVRLQRGDPEARFKLGGVLVKSGRYDEAIRQFS